MKFLKTILLSILTFSVSSPHAAGIPVIDSSNLAQSIQQVTAWSEQYQQMVEQLDEMKKQLENASGVRGMADLANDPALREYLPDEYQSLLTEGVGQWEAIYEAAKVFDVADPQNQEILEANRKQAAINRASAEEAYKTASERFAGIQELLDKINDAPDAKDIADLTARISAEQVMMMNEANKLAAMQAANEAQRDIKEQRAIERSIQSLYKPLPDGW